MDSWKSDICRVILASSLAFLVGAIYYNPFLNPLMDIWMKITYPGITDPRTVTDPMLPMIGTAVSLLLIATVVNRYVNLRQLSTSRLIIMAVELWLLVILFSLPKTLWGNYSLVKFAIDHIYDLLVALTVSVTLGYRRFPVVVDTRNPQWLFDGDVEKE